MTLPCKTCRCVSRLIAPVWSVPMGPTHAGAFDVGYLSALPNMTVMAAADEAELVHMVATAAAHDSGPIAFRYPRGEGEGVEMPDVGEALEIGKGRIIQDGSDIAILSFGAHLGESRRAAEMLEAKGVCDHRGRAVCEATGPRIDPPACQTAPRVDDG